MNYQDMFVATVAVGIALFLISSALFDWDWSYQLDKAQRIESQWGRPAARVFYITLGVILLTLAWTIASTARPVKPVGARAVNQP